MKIVLTCPECGEANWKLDNPKEGIFRCATCGAACDIDEMSSEVEEVDNTPYFGVVRWQLDDIKAALADRGYPITQDNIDEIVTNCVNNHFFTDTMIEAGWDMIYATIDMLANDGKITKDRW